MTDKRGISDIIVTVIIVGLALAAVAAVWAVVSGLISSGTKTIDVGGKCLAVTVQAVGVTCLNGTGVVSGSGNVANCTVTLQRTGTGSDVLGGLKLVLKNNATNSGVLDMPGDVAVLVGKTSTVLNSTFANQLALPVGGSSVDVTVYFKDTTGKTSLCTQTNTFTF